jgi:hypothetical protein
MVGNVKGSAIAPDGLTWEIYVTRVNRPRFHESDFDPLNSPGTGSGGGLVIPEVDPLALVEAIFDWVILPVFWLLPNYFWNAMRSLGSSARWVEARSYWPTDVHMVWRTSKAEANAVAEYLIATLPITPQRYPPYDLRPPGAELVALKLD